MLRAIRESVAASIVALCLSFCCICSTGEWMELSQSARSAALGGVKFILAEGGDATLHNAAALAWQQRRVLDSSLERQPGLLSCGDVSFATRRLGAALSYFSLWGISAVDELGNTIGTFSYQALTVTASFGLKLAQIPVLSSRPASSWIGTGWTVRAWFARPTQHDSAVGMAFDLPILFCFDLSHRVVGVSDVRAVSYTHLTLPTN